MNKIQSKLLVTLFIFAFSQTAFSSIDDGAPSAAHHFEAAAGEFHDYLHHHYDNSYGSHDLEELGSEIHHVLHEYAHGEASEEEVVAAQDELKLVWNEFLRIIHSSKVLNKDDLALDQLYQDVKEAYKELRFLLRKAK